MQNKIIEQKDETKQNINNRQSIKRNRKQNETKQNTKINTVLKVHLHFQGKRLFLKKQNKNEAQFCGSVLGLVECKSSQLRAKL